MATWQIQFLVIPAVSPGGNTLSTGANTASPAELSVAGEGGKNVIADDNEKRSTLIATP